jgi:hypothetical protein
VEFGCRGTVLPSLAASFLGIKEKISELACSIDFHLFHQRSLFGFCFSQLQFLLSPNKILGNRRWNISEYAENRVNSTGRCGFESDFDFFVTCCYRYWNRIRNLAEFGNFSDCFCYRDRYSLTGGEA